MEPNTLNRYQVFINYRQSDTYEAAQRLKEKLEDAFEHLLVFKDNSDIREGDSLWKKISSALAQVDVVLALIDDKWHEHPHPSSIFKNRLQYEEDWVAKELKEARRLGKVVIPILYKGASLPAPDETQTVLPSSLDFLNSDLLCARIGKDYPDSDMERFFETLASKFKFKRKTGATTKLEPSDPLVDFPLPASIRKQLPARRAPFLGLHYFEEKDARLFFGRSQEILDLLKKIHFGSIRVLLLHGYSGVGKSSLLNAGFFPRLREAGWRIVADRRDPSKPLQQLLRSLFQKGMEAKSDKKQKLLLAIDQLEEALLDPSGNQPEFPAFFDQLKEYQEAQPEVKFLLSFRKEFFPEVRVQLERRDIGFLDHFLQPLTKEGIRQAITGAWQEQDLRAKYQNFDFEPADLPDEIIQDLAQDVNWDKPEAASSKAPFLQFQLASLWEACVKDQQGAIPLKLTEKIYRNTVRKKNLSEELQGRINKLAEFEQGRWGRWEYTGLVLDILYYFTTDRNTSGAHDDLSLLARYTSPAHPDKEELLGLIRGLERFQLLSRFIYEEHSEAGQSQKLGWTRLAHDSLAPIIREKYNRSEKPGQKASRILKAKGKHVLEKTDQRRFSESDIEVIKEGLSGMPRIDEGMNEKINQDEQFYLEQRKADFELAFSSAVGYWEELEIEKALSSFERALRTGEGSKDIFQVARETPYPLAFLAQKVSLAKALELICSIPDNHSGPWEKLKDQMAQLPAKRIFPTLKDYLAAHHQELGDKLADRFFPLMKEVPGGTYEMGAKDKELVFNREGPAHKVLVDAFRMGETPVTYWQYGLYCLDTGRAIPRDSGFGKGDRPVINVSWYEAIAYLNWLSEKDGRTPVYDLPSIPFDPNDLHQQNIEWSEIVNWEADGYRLPTEAEWEFAACVKIEKKLLGREKVRKYRFGNGKDIIDPEAINFDASSLSNHYAIDRDWMQEILKDKFRAQTTPVKAFADQNNNPYELLDMSGNVFEWCWDWFAGDLSDQPDAYFEACKKRGLTPNPKGAEKGSYRLVRGGSWLSNALNCRASFRSRYYPVVRVNYIGFRVVRR